MATIQDVQDAIDAHAASVAAEQTAINNLNAADAVVVGAIATEIATFTTAQQTYNAALSAARDAAGFPAALAARDAATIARETAANDLRQVMQDFIATP